MGGKAGEEVAVGLGVEVVGREILAEAVDGIAGRRTHDSHPEKPLPA
jgi:hypothetical protein